MKQSTYCPVVERVPKEGGRDPDYVQSRKGQVRHARIISGSSGSSGSSGPPTVDFFLVTASRASLSSTQPRLFLFHTPSRFFGAGLLFSSSSTELLLVGPFFWVDDESGNLEADEVEAKLACLSWYKVVRDSETVFFSRFKMKGGRGMRMNGRVR